MNVGIRPISSPCCKDGNLLHPSYDRMSVPDP
jgi:hypothetical protein